jgi:rhamnulokinase
MSRYFLAIDIGASSGRHILFWLEDGKMRQEEIYRFPNGNIRKNGHLIWDVDSLFEHILAGMKECGRRGVTPVSVGVDTWGVDFVLLDAAGKRLGDAVGYRDSRTDHADEYVKRFLSEEELYARTGIQKQKFNTIYQLAALKEQEPELLEKADKLLMLPDYFHWMLSGRAVTEYTEATTGQLVSPTTFDWDYELIEKLGYPEKIFQPMVSPGTVLGDLKPEIAQQVGFTCKVVEPGTHDTASAVLAVPSQSDAPLYISSGTWSLMGTELHEAICTPQAQKANLTNEGGYDRRFRFLKNIMGLWMIQSVKKEIGQDLSFGEIADGASKTSITSLVPANDDRFLAPENMTREVQAACREQGEQVPDGIFETASVIYRSLAKCYAQTIEEIEAITGRRYDAVHIVGGGSNADYLNRLTAQATGRKVLAGPGEATAIGNAAAQMIAAGELKDRLDARRCVGESYAVKVYEP